MLDRIWTAVSNQWPLFLSITVAVICLLAIFVIFLPQIWRLKKRNLWLERECTRLLGVTREFREKGAKIPLPPPQPLVVPASPRPPKKSPPPLPHQPQLIGGALIDGPARLNSRSEAHGNVRGAFLAIETRSSCQNLVPCGCTQVQPMFEPDRESIDDDGEPVTSHQRVQCVECGAERPNI